MLQRRWPIGLLLFAICCGGLMGCSAKPAEEKPAVEREQARKQQINRAGREGGAK